MIDNRFDPKAREGAIYDAWEKAGAFQPRGEGEAFSIVIPPPNVTGVLHIGHALNNTLQDVLARFARMQGKRVLWQPGTDHAGIATQMVVERQLAADGGNESRASLGREKFVERVWEWKEESGGAIMQQVRRLGATCDWSRERFTMGEKGKADDQMVAAVTKVFVDLYNEGLIYRDKRLVNWDPHFQTAISDLEVENREVKGHFWHLKYPIEDGSTWKRVVKDEDGNDVEEDCAFMIVATTRPETMLGDTAVAVHPDDERYRHLVGKMVRLPIADRLIPIVADEHADPSKGTGAVKITPAHDFNDYQVGKRCGLPMVNVLDAKAAILATFDHYSPDGSRADSHLSFGEQKDDVIAAPSGYGGLDRFDARKNIVADLEALGLMHEIEAKKVEQPFGDRSGVVIEPWLTDQWYVDAKTLAKPAVEAVESGATNFVPKNWEKTYFEWMRNIEPWCVSRQLWWGHRIPAWFGARYEKAYEGDGAPMRFVYDSKKFFVAATFDEARTLAEEYYAGSGVAIVVAGEADSAGDAHDRSMAAHDSKEFPGKNPYYLWRDEDVLDTWFSSALWPFSTMGWPDETSELKEFYPTSVLVTAHDIIFFWVARMMMQGLHFMDGVAPFKDVYIHALVRDEKGQKMSKSKGNVIDPLELVDEYGADALRMTLAAMAAQGRDIKLSKQRVEGYRNFSTKLWNAFRFSQMNECKLDPDFDPGKVKHTLNKWVIAEAAKASAEIAKAIEGYRFDAAAGAAYRFVWNVFCDWYLELVKPVMAGENAADIAETRATTAWALDQMVHVLHPFMPFITEELYQTLRSDAGIAVAPDEQLILRPWPKLDGLSDAAAEAEVDWVIALISAVRSARQDVNVPAGPQVPMTLVGANEVTRARLETYRALIERLARVRNIELVDAAPKGTIRFVLDEAMVCLSVAELIDLGAEKERLKKEIGKLEGEVAGLQKRLGNPEFVKKAPPEVVEEQHERVAVAGVTIGKLSEALAQLGEAG